MPAAMVALLLLPLWGFLVTSANDGLNPVFGTPEGHFYIVSATCFVAGAVGGAFLISIKSLSQTRSVFLGLGFVALAIIFMSHGLATPGVIFSGADGYGNVVRVSAGFSLAICTLLITLSVLPWDGLHARLAHTGHLVAAGGIAVVVAYLAVALWNPAVVDILPINEATDPAIGAAVIALLAFSAWRYWRAWRLTRFPAQFAMVVALAFLAQAQISMVYGDQRHLNWWLYHFLLLGAFLTVVAGWTIEAVRARSLVLFARSLTLREALDNLDSAAPEALIRLEAAMEERDSYTRHHMSRTAFVATAIAREMCCDPVTVAVVEGAARIHDIGKIAVPDAILLKSGPLTDREFKQVKGHTLRGEQIARSAGSLAHLAPVVRGHHERFAGGGYPDGLAGDQIPLAARIVAVADTFDALTSTRSYRSARSIGTALRELERVTGSQLDPVCVRAFLRWFEREGRDAFEPDEATAVTILMAA
jgi:HD-GYP domain-containing protein (c-di-GMP phosphodiesterase class II)